MLLKLKMNLLYGYGLQGAKGRREQVEFYGFYLYRFILLVKKG
jgi:hypothetical protein